MSFGVHCFKKKGDVVSTIDRITRDRIVEVYAGSYFAAEEQAREQYLEELENGARLLVRSGPSKYDIANAIEEGKKLQFGIAGGEDFVTKVIGKILLESSNEEPTKYVLLTDLPGIIIYYKLVSKRNKGYLVKEDIFNLMKAKEQIF